MPGETCLEPSRTFTMDSFPPGYPSDYLVHLESFSVSVTTSKQTLFCNFLICMTASNERVKVFVNFE